MFSPMDIEVGIALQTNPKVAPTTGDLLTLDYIPGSMMTVSSAVIESTTLKPNRASAGQRRGRREVSGSFNVRLHRDAAISLIFASLLGTEWVEAGEAGEGGDTLKSGKKSIPLMIVQTGTADDGSVKRDQFLGCTVTGISFSAENGAGIEMTINFMGLDAETDIAGASPLKRVEASNELELIGDDVMNITVAGVSITDFTKLDFSAEQAREGAFVLGSKVAVANSASAPRKVSGSLEYFRPTGATPGFTGDAQGMSFDLLDAYAVDMSAVYFSEPQQNYGGANVVSTVTFTAGYNNTAGTDITITRP